MHTWDTNHSEESLTLERNEGVTYFGQIFFSKAMNDQNKEEGVSLAVIARLFKSLSFKNDNTRITKKTLELSSEYIRLFIHEALLRSNEARIAEVPMRQVDGIDNLEKDNDERNDEDENSDSLSKMEDSDNELSSEEGEMTNFNSQNKTAVNPAAEMGNDALDLRHLAKVGGILILDF